MPRCPSCQSIVLPEAIIVEDDVVSCERCDDQPSNYVADVRFTEQDVQLEVKTPSAGVVFATSWDDAVRWVRGLGRKPVKAVPQLRAVEEEAAEG